MNRKTMLDLFPNFTTGAIFSAMITPPWLGVINGSELDFEYFTRYGTRFAGSMTLAVAGSGVMPPEGTAHIARLLQAHYKHKWSMLWKTFSSEYNPIENYNMEEIGKDKTVRHDEHSSQGSDDIEYLGTENNSTESQIYGFDSVSGADSDKSASTRTFAGRQDNHSLTDSGSTDGTDTVDHTLTRHGNVGVTSNQQMMEQEVNFRNKWEYFDIIFADVNKLLTLPIYEMEGI